MPLQSQRATLRNLALAVLLAVGIFATTGTSGVAHARAATPTTCISAVEDVWSRYENVEFQTQSIGSCYADFPSSTGYVIPCTGGRVTTNADVWLSQSTVPGSKRLAESGRTGYLTWASDCKDHELTSVTGWGQYYTTPL